MLHEATNLRLGHALEQLRHFSVAFNSSMSADGFRLKRFKWRPASLQTGLWRSPSRIQPALWCSGIADGLRA